MNELATKTFGEAIRHRLALILLVVALFGVAGVVAARLTPPTYQASSQVYVEPSNSSVDPSNNLLNSYWLNQATNYAVLQNASARLGHGENPQRLQPALSANVLKASNVVQITASAWYPQQAADRANAVAQALADQNKANVASQSAQQQQVLEARLNQLQPQINSTQAALNGNPNSTALQTQLSSLYSSYTDTQNQLQQMKVSSANQANSVRVNLQAPVPLKPSAPDLRLYVGGGLLVGLVVGVLLALLLERFDDRVRTSAQLGRAAGTSLVVGMPDSWRRRESERNLYTLALAHLFARHPDATRILTVAVLPDQFANEAAERLGAAAAGLGRHAQVMGVESSPVDEYEAPNSEVAAEAAGGYVGNAPATATIPLLQTRRIRPRHPELADDDAAVTIIAAPSPMSSPAAVTAGRQADVGVLVVTAHRTRLSQVRQAADALRATGLDVGGAILVPRPRSWLRRLLGQRAD